ncbi:MAG TPA: DUF4058 family protein [Gemmataceae bacterium]|nr:DUF4058 family protein [Gemmataceae bacterium]
MKSPFPGMDPFLELPAYGSDFHATCVNYWREAIADALPPQYEATLGERVYLIERDPDERKLGFPDVAVTHDERQSSAASMAGTAATLAPVIIPLTIMEGPKETYIEILHQPERSLVTTLELLSPANKEQPGRTEYLAKRRALLVQNVHLVELDLLMEGRRLQKSLPPADYYYLLCRAEQRPDCEVYRWMLGQPLPVLPVPLRHPDPDLAIDLGAVFTLAYERGRFYRRIRYQEPLPAFLNAADRSWAASLLQKEE